jgi:solute carrier family 39 (zinc transporter), member 1/2/3
MLDILAILAIALIGGALPLVLRWRERGLHTALALSTGIFMGAVFLHFLPALSTLSLSAQNTSESAHGHGGDMWLWFFVLVGVLGVYLVESLVLRTHDHDDLHRHRSVGWAALLGLSVHALTTGVGYGATREQAEVSSTLLIAILAHKGFEAFSLTTVFQLAKVPRPRLIALICAFALVTPAGILLGDGLTSSLGSAGVAILTALAAGTFLYVCLCELLVEVFHHRDNGVLKVLLLAAGIGLTLLFEGIGYG